MVMWFVQDGIFYIIIILNVGLMNVCSAGGVAVCNLETPINKVVKRFEKPYRFSSPVELLDAMAVAGFQFIATANNHCFDTGIEGMKETIQEMDQRGINHTGTFADRMDRRYAVLEVGKMRVGIISLTYGTNAHVNKLYLEKGEEYYVNLTQAQELSGKFVRYVYGNNQSLMGRVARRLYFRYLSQFTKNSGIIAPHERNEFSRKQRQAIEVIIKEMKADCDFMVALLHDGRQHIKEPSDRLIGNIKWLQQQGINFVVGNHEHIVSGIFRKEDFLATYALGDLTGSIGIKGELESEEARYSIRLNMYVDSLGQVRYTFSILKRVEREGSILPIPLYKLWKDANDEVYKEELCRQNRHIYNRFTGQNEQELEMKIEYVL